MPPKSSFPITFVLIIVIISPTVLAIRNEPPSYAKAAKNTDNDQGDMLVVLEWSNFGKFVWPSSFIMLVILAYKLWYCCNNIDTQDNITSSETNATGNNGQIEMVGVKIKLTCWGSCKGIKFNKLTI